MVMKQLCIYQVEDVTPLPPLPDGPRVLEDFGGHPSDEEVAFPDTMVRSRLSFFVLIIKHSSALNTLGRWNE